MSDLPATAPKKTTVDVLSKSTIDSSVIEKEAVGETASESEVQRKKVAPAVVEEGGAEDPGNEVLANFFQSLLAKKPGTE
jgi:hypothetical protein